MRILLVFGHPDRVEANLILGLKAAGLELAMTNHPSDQFKELLAANGLQITDLNLKSRFDLSSILTLRKLMREGNFDIVHSFSSRALSNSLLASIGLKVKHVAYRGTSGHLSRIDPSARMSYLSSRVDKIICVSNAVKQYLASRSVPEQKLVTIYKGHDPAWYTAAPRTELSQFNIPNDAIVIGCAANMRPVKGIDLLIKAFEKLENSSAHLLLVGEVRDGEITRLANASKIKDRIHLTGYRSDATALIGACDISVMPSRAREGLPKAVIEAMSLGVATIVSDVGGMPEIVEDMKSGLVVPAGDVNALSGALSKLIADSKLREQLAENGRQRIRSDFSINGTIKQTIELYRSL